MDVADALASRHSVRAFLDKPVTKEQITRILDVARFAPSGVNTQPWQVAVVLGDTKRHLCADIVDAFHAGMKANMDYQYYPEEWFEPYKARRIECGLLMYSTLDIAREEKEKRMQQWAANYNAFGAPAILFFFMDSGLDKGSYLDMGMFFQSVMLAAQADGLATCPQAALAEYPELVKEALGYPLDSILISGMALGYEDVNAPVNSYRTSREEVAAFTRFYD